jgi:replication protein A-like
MAGKKTKSVSFDAMVKFFMQTYGIPTRKDVDRVIARLDRLENLVKSGTIVSRGRKPAAVKEKVASQAKGKGSGMTASDTVLSIIKHSKNGVGFADIQKKAGFPEKKLRNIIFRLNKLEKIKRKDRGIYLAV